jgi:hypothetical protein
MLPANPFFKQFESSRDGGSKLRNEKMLNMPRTAVYTSKDRMRDAELQAVRDKYNPNLFNTATRPFMGHHKFGFQTLLSGESKPLPTAPAIVGGNVDWTQKAVNPNTMFLHSEIMNKRQMLPPPMMGAKMFVKEPNQNSIHTNI